MKCIMCGEETYSTDIANIGECCEDQDALTVQELCEFLDVPELPVTLIASKSRRMLEALNRATSCGYVVVVSTGREMLTSLPKSLGYPAQCVRNIPSGRVLKWRHTPQPYTLDRVPKTLHGNRVLHLIIP